jgi:subtilase family serine protease
MTRVLLDEGGTSRDYEAPITSSWARAVGGRSLRFSFQARNPFMFTNYWSFDPEYNNFGATNLNRFIDLAPFPSARQFFLSVDVGW